MTNPLIAARDQFVETHPEQRHIIRGRDWGVIDVGSGPVLLMIPGTLGRADIFWNQIDAFSRNMRVIAISYPAGGGITDWAGDITALLDELGIESVALLGSSLGGYLAQYFAAIKPARVSKLFAANTLHSVIGLDQRPPYSLDLDNTPIGDLRQGFAGGLGNWAQAHPDQSDLVDLLLAEVNGRIPEAELRTRIKALKFGPELPELALDPKHIITIETDDDPLIPAEIRAAVRARLSPALAHRFSWGGHFPYVSRAAEYSELLANNIGE